MNDTFSNSTVSADTKPSAVSKRDLWLICSALFLLMLMGAAALGACFYLWEQTNTTQSKWMQATIDQQKTVAAVDKIAADLQDAQATSQQEAEKAAHFRERTVAVLAENSEKLQNLDRIDTSYWRLAEAEFLLTQAQQRLFIARDAATADLLLASADGALMKQKDPSLLPVRSAIAKDRAALRKVPHVDRDGIYLRLQTLSSQTGLLTSGSRFLQAADEPAAADDAGQNYSERLWKLFLNIVRIHHYDQDVEPLLPPEQEVYMRQNLQLALVQAQLGLLQSQQQTYLSNLERVDAWVNQYCQTEDPLVRSWLDDVQALMRIDIAPELPDISDSLRAAQKIIEQRADDIQRSLRMQDEESETENTPSDKNTPPASKPESEGVLTDPEDVPAQQETP